MREQEKITPTAAMQLYVCGQMLEIYSNHSRNYTCVFFFLAYVSILCVHTCAEIPLRQGLQDGVHGSHVEDEAQLGHTHGDEAQQEDGTEYALHEGLSCRGKERRAVITKAVDSLQSAGKAAGNSSVKPRPACSYREVFFCLVSLPDLYSHGGKLQPCSCYPG